MSKRKVMELLLDKVELEHTGSMSSRKGTHVVVVNLIWPRPAIAERSAVKTIKLEGNSAVPGKSEWIDRILFKETVEGPFGITASVTEPLSDGALAKFLSYAGSSLFKIAGGEVEDMMPVPLLGNMAGIPFVFLSKLVKERGEMPADVIAEGGVSLKAATGSKAVKKKIVIPLTVPKNVYRTTGKRGPRSGPARRKVILKEGESNGCLYMSAQIK
ncbi:hypothetical protein BVX97_04935 [bacterium E08(2017)]|nr:hypothetical protein BVX97_04935 [bacterium E08(2017)]